jgi:hypothetical protein
VASDKWNAVTSAIQDAVGVVTGWLSTKWDEIKSTASSKWDEIKGAAKTAWDAVYQAIIQPIQDAINWVNEKIGGLVSPIQTAWDTISGIFGDITTGAANAASAVASTVTAGIGPGLPHAAAGGYVNPMPGGFPILVAEGGSRERIEPLDPQGLSARDRAMISHIVTATIASVGGMGGGSAVDVNVNVNAGAMRGIIDATVAQSQSTLARRVGRVRGLTT